MVALVGYTGFVGSNIMAMGKIDRAYNSKNISEAYGLQPDLLIYAGLRAEKFLANRDPAGDLETILEAERNIAAIDPKQLVLISTVDVYRDPDGVDEESPIGTEGLQAYGANRYALECWVREHYPAALIIRLPALFGRNIKKNFIYDYISYIPAMLKGAKMAELSAREGELLKFYELQDNGFYRCRALAPEERAALKQRFVKLGFSALHFTDSRSTYQFYPLRRLWEDINTALAAGILLWNPATEPVSAAEVYQFLSGEQFVNELSGEPARYDYGTVHAAVFGGKGRYIMEKEEILREIQAFVSDIWADQASQTL